MIFPECDSINAVDELLKKIRIKETQLKIAQESGMSYVAQALTEQLVELRAQLSDAPDPEFQSLMSLLDN
ncbi:hypothetical protein [Nostoc sp. MS1]|uniref:hypothetical protein n=1 Tax=Nostoc sp. MS1 TaxID=2764711 RepID=UPI001CC6BD8B|nr:hypothetical protein [Nostoc sp. MS1]BCL39739.1 hypothetical protein NSMS1_61860 [Nostoc sp. MS1]